MKFNFFELNQSHFSCIVFLLMFSITSCQKSSLLGKKEALSLTTNPTNPVTPSDPTDGGGENSGDGGSEGPEDPPGGTGHPRAGEGCTPELTDFCYGGYGDDTSPKSIPSKVIFLTPAGLTAPSNPAKDSKTLIDAANNFLIYDNHRFIHFAKATYEQKSITQDELTNIVYGSDAVMDR